VVERATPAKGGRTDRGVSSEDTRKVSEGGGYIYTYIEQSVARREGTEGEQNHTPSKYRTSTINCLLVLDEREGS
jgi:hypothetical protein